jgi:hypothetical protein
MLYLKAALFVITGLAAAFLLIVQQPTLITAALLAIVIWAFCRAYYFAFYVVERYVDRSYQFSGLISFTRYVYARRRSAKPPRSRA